MRPIFKKYSLVFAMLAAMLAGALLFGVSARAEGAQASVTMPDQPGPAGVIVIKNDNGGGLMDNAKWWNHVARSSINVRIEGYCDSACTQFLGIVPFNRVCMAAGSRLGFHAISVQNRKTGVFEVSMDATQLFIQTFYPPPVREWLNNRTIGSQILPMAREVAVGLGVAKPCVD
jgi:hypothetical protein